MYPSKNRLFGVGSKPLSPSQKMIFTIVLRALALAVFANCGTPLLEVHSTVIDRRTRLLMEGSEARLLIVGLGCHRNDREKTTVFSQRKPSDGGIVCRSGISCFMPFVFLLVWSSFSFCCQGFSEQSRKSSKEKNESVRPSGRYNLHPQVLINAETVHVES
jgi:hypothetical protein